MVSWKNPLLGLIYNWLKVIALLSNLFLFVACSIYFFKLVWALKGEAFVFAMGSFVVLYLGLIYHVYSILFHIYTRGFVYLDDLIKLLIVTCILVLLQMFTEELHLTPVAQIWENYKKSKERS
jgi:hypothetical protein